MMGAHCIRALIPKQLRRKLGAVKRWLSHYQQMATSRLQHHRNKLRHLRLYEPNISRAPDRDMLASFVEDGVVVVRNFLRKDVVKQIMAEVRPSVEAVADNRYAGPLRTFIGEEGGLFRLYEVDESLAPSSRAFFQSAFIADLADSVCRPGMHSADRYVDYKANGGRDMSIGYHIDSWKLRFKAFLLLQDVTEDHAPFVYVKGSHREERWRRRWDWGYQHNFPAGSYLRPDEVRKICRRFGYQEQVFTGAAGDLIIADTRGIHRGNPLRRGTRLQLVNLYKMNGPADYAC